MAPLLDKEIMRRLMRARRAQLDPALGVDLAEALLAAKIIECGGVVAGYWPLPGEIDIRPLLVTLAGRGHRVGLPVTPPSGEPLTFRNWQPGATMRPGRFGTQEPEGPVVVPSVLLLPLLAFDRRGARLGYGGGFYDRTIAGLQGPVTLIGCCFAAQEVDSVPTDTHDRPMHAVATEAGVIFME